MGRVTVAEAIILKMSHARHLPEVLFDNYERPLESETMRPANESCERCHWPPAFHGDTVRELVRFEPDEQNSEQRTYVILKTGGGQRDMGLGYGIHWHIENQVEFIATDDGMQEILVKVAFTVHARPMHPGETLRCAGRERTPITFAEPEGPHTNTGDDWIVLVRGVAFPMPAAQAMQLLGHAGWAMLETAPSGEVELDDLENSEG